MRNKNKARYKTANKRQQRNFEKAKQILAQGITSDNCRAWDNLFENGYNDANSLIWELYKDSIVNVYTKRILEKNKKFLPTILLKAVFLEV